MLPPRDDMLNAAGRIMSLTLVGAGTLGGFAGSFDAGTFIGTLVTFLISIIGVVGYGLGKLGPAFAEFQKTIREVNAGSLAGQLEVVTQKLDRAEAELAEQKRRDEEHRQQAEGDLAEFRKREEEHRQLIERQNAELKRSLEAAYKSQAERIKALEEEVAQLNRQLQLERSEKSRLLQQLSREIHQMKSAPDSGETPAVAPPPAGGPR